MAPKYQPKTIALPGEMILLGTGTSVGVVVGTGTSVAVAVTSGSGVAVATASVAVGVATGSSVAVGVGSASVGVAVGTGPLQVSQHEATTVPPRLVHAVSEDRGRQRLVTAEPGS